MDPRNFFVPTNRGQFPVGNQGPLNSGFPPTSHVDRGGQWLAPASQAAYSNTGVPTSTQVDGRPQVMYADFLGGNRNDFVLDPAVAAPSYHADYSGQQGRPPSQHPNEPVYPSGFIDRVSGQTDHNIHPQGPSPRYLDQQRLLVSGFQELRDKYRDLEQDHQVLKAQFRDLEQGYNKKTEEHDRKIHEMEKKFQGYILTLANKIERGQELQEASGEEVKRMLTDKFKRWESLAEESVAANVT